MIGTVARQVPQADEQSLSNNFDGTLTTRRDVFGHEFLVDSSIELNRLLDEKQCVIVGSIRVLSLQIIAYIIKGASKEGINLVFTHKLQLLQQQATECFLQLSMQAAKVLPVLEAK